MDSSVRPVLRALGDETRFRIYTWLRQWDAPVTINEIAEAFDLHPNTVRPHLDLLREAGLVRLDTSSQGSVGRPQHRYTAVEADIELHRHPESDDAFELLARLLAETCCSQTSSPTTAVEIGRTTGRSMAAGSMAAGSMAAGSMAAGSMAARDVVANGVSRGQRAVPADGLQGMSRDTVAHRPADVLEHELGRIGFEVTIEGDRVAFTACPFRTLAEAYPDLVCALHEGLTCGIVEESGDRLVEFHGLDDRAQCTAVLAGRAT